MKQNLNAGATDPIHSDGRSSRRLPGAVVALKPAPGRFRRIGSVATVGLSMLLSVAVSGCQSGVEGMEKEFGKSEIKAPSSGVDEAYGTRGAEITLLIPKGAGGVYDGVARDIRDGAALAVGDVGDEQVFLKVIDVSGGPAAVPAAIESARSRNAVLLVSHASPAVTSAVASIPADERPALFNLAAQSSVAASAGGVYNFGEDEIGSAMEAVRAAVANKHRKIVVFAPTGFTAAQETRLTAAIRGAGATVLGIGRYELNDAAAAAAVQKLAGAVREADTVLVMGSTVIATTIVGAVKAAGRPNIAFLGTSAWPKQAYRIAAANGTLIAKPDAEGTAMIASRYQARYQRALSEEAANGYDAVAVAAGLVRTKGTEALTPATLTSGTGFRGVTGLFRLKNDGSVERLYSLGMIEGGELKPLRPSPAAF